MVREGYKMTELGEIPEDWEAIKLIELADEKDRHSFTGGPFGSDLKRSDYVEEGIQVIQLQNIEVGRFNGNNKIFTTEEKANQLKSCNIYPGDIIIAKMAEPVARACIIPGMNEKYLMSSDGIRLSVNKDRFNNVFITYAINSKYFRKQAEANSTGTTRLRIGLTALKNLNIAVPQFKEQQKIADILSTVDEQLEQTYQLIEKTKELKKGLMQQLLTKGIGHTEFKQTEVGEIPIEWSCVQLKEILEVQGGYAFKSKDSVPSGVKWLKIANVGMGKISWADHSYLPNNYLNEFNDYRLNNNDIVMAMTRPVLRNQTKVSKITNSDTPSLLNQRVCRYIFSEMILSDYFYQFARTEKFANSIQDQILGTDPPNISANQIKSILISLPPIDEQQKIADILSSVDAQIEEYTTKKAKLEQLKKALMQQLLTGKIRVNV